MKKLILALVATTLVIPSVAIAQVRVDGYTKKDGTYVAPHYRSSPNSSPYDNYSTKGNTNPYTGQAGTKEPYSTNPYRAPAKTPCYFNCPN